MKTFFGEKIYVLGLKKNDSKKWRNYFQQNFPKEKLIFWMEEGVKKNKNDGVLDTSLDSILNFNICDPVSKDIFFNHVKIFRNAMKQNYQTIMILEDDAIFPNFNSNKWDKVQEDLTKNDKQWDICYLGYAQWPIVWSTFITLNIIKLYSPLTTHAYIIDKNGIQKFLNFYQQNPTLQDKMHIDKALHKTPGMKKTGVFPMMAYQSTSPALFTKALDKMNISIKFSTFCQWNEWICICIPIFILLSICVIIFFLLTAKTNKNSRK